jgi:hypothetical protein
MFGVTLTCVGPGEGGRTYGRRRPPRVDGVRFAWCASTCAKVEVRDAVHRGSLGAIISFQENTRTRSDPRASLRSSGPRVCGCERRSIFEGSTSTRRSVVALWVTLAFAGSILAFMAQGPGPLPGDLTVTRWLQEWLPPDGLSGSLLTYTGRLVWLLPVAFLAVAAAAVACGAVRPCGSCHRPATQRRAQAPRGARTPLGRAGAGLRAVGRLRLP